MNPIFNWVLVALGVLMGSLGSLLMKVGAAGLAGGSDESVLSVGIRAAFNPFIVGGIVLYAIPAAIWIWLLRSMPLTILQPALSMTYVVWALLALLVLREPVPVMRWCGIAVIIAGVVLVARS
jgi:drug/metabolite transporter (DMT)-like permease